MNQRRILGIAVAAVLLTGVAWAGMGYTMKCKACKFEQSVIFGGGRMFNQVTAWCDPCGKFVYLRWKRSEAEPKPLATIWDAETGRKLTTYACPDCGKPATMVDENMKFCPKCGKAEFGKDPNAPVMAVD